MSDEQGKPWSEARRSQRIVARLPVHIYGHKEDGSAFQEVCQTISVNSHGALVLMSAPVKDHQRLLLMNPATEEEIQCRVAFVGPTRGGKTEVGVEFTTVSTKFWRMSFPPVDWRPSRHTNKPS